MLLHLLLAGYDCGQLCEIMSVLLLELVQPMRVPGTACLLLLLLLPQLPHQVHVIPLQLLHPDPPGLAAGRAGQVRGAAVSLPGHYLKMFLAL